MSVFRAVRTRFMLPFKGFKCLSPTKQNSRLLLCRINGVLAESLEMTHMPHPLGRSACTTHTYRAITNWRIARENLNRIPNSFKLCHDSFRHHSQLKSVLWKIVCNFLDSMLWETNAAYKSRRRSRGPLRKARAQSKQTRPKVGQRKSSLSTLLLHIVRCRCRRG